MHGPCAPVRVYPYFTEGRLRRDRQNWNKAIQKMQKTAKRQKKTGGFCKEGQA